LITFLSNSKEERNKQTAVNINTRKCDKERDLTAVKNLEKMVCTEISPILTGRTHDCCDLQLTEIIPILGHLTQTLVEYRKTIESGDSTNEDTLIQLEENRQNLDKKKLKKLEEENQDLMTQMKSLQDDSIELKKMKTELEKLQSDNNITEKWSARLETEKLALQTDLEEIKNENTNMKKLCEEYEAKLSQCTCTQQSDGSNNSELETDAQGYMPIPEGQKTSDDQDQRSDQHQILPKNPSEREQNENSLNNNDNVVVIISEDETAPKQPFTSEQESSEMVPKQMTTSNFFDVQKGEWIHDISNKSTVTVQRVPSASVSVIYPGENNSAPSAISNINLNNGIFHANEHVHVNKNCIVKVIHYHHCNH